MRKLFAIFFCSVLFISCKNEKTPDKDPSSIRIPDSSGKLKTTVQVNPYAAIDVSPMDMSYFPVDYQKNKTDTTSQPPLARLIYSRPHLQGRKLFDDILKYGEPWRLGANESTELDLYAMATIQGKQIKEGRYVIYCIPEKDHWTIVLNSNIDSWGLHPDSTKDLNRFVIPVQKNTEALEYFTIVFRSAGSGAELYMAWDDVSAALPISFLKRDQAARFAF